MTVGQKIREARGAMDMTQAELGEAIGVRQSVISEMEAGKLKNWPLHASKLIRVLGRPRSFFEPEDEVHGGNLPELPDVDPLLDYVEVEVLPTFAGMGGGGTGEGEPAKALVARSLVFQELRADPADLLIIDVRGDSMLDPATGKGFAHGDQLMVNRRDNNPRQPGPFALWFDDGYVVKNVEIIRKTGKYRIFSNNPAYSDDEADPAEVQIMGRPVWFARRL